MVARALEDALGPIAEQASLTTIGAVVSSDLIRQALILIVVGSLGIVLWITYRFRDVKFGVTRSSSLLHDVIVVVGVFAILGTFFHVEIDALFVTAMLTVIGFSVHDTIVVFDRIRENKARHAGRAVPRDRQPLDPADLRPLDHDQPDRGADAARAVPVRRGRDQRLRPGPADRDRLRDVLVDLRGQPAAGRLAACGTTGGTAAGATTPRAARRGRRPEAAGALRRWIRGEPLVAS